MTWPHLLAPVVVATILNFAFAAAAWRGTQIERATGKDPWWLGCGMVIYGAAAALFIYVYGSEPLTWGPGICAAAMFSQALGAVVIYATLHAFLWTRGQPWRERAVPMTFAIGLTGFMVAGLFVIR